MPIKINPRETAMLDENIIGGLTSFKRLKKRYLGTSLINAAKELCDFLRENGDKKDLFDRYRVAERALYPGFGAIGYNRGSNNESINGSLNISEIEIALYYWIALRDLNPGTPELEGKNLIVLALYQLQRDRNFDDAFVDDRDIIDKAACTTGVIGKFAEVLNGKHPDVKIAVDIDDKILHLVKVLIARKLFASKILEYNKLISPQTDFRTLVTAPMREAILIEIKMLLNDEMSKKKQSKLPEWLMDGSLEYLNYFYNDGKPWSKQYLDQQIAMIESQFAKSTPKLVNSYSYANLINNVAEQNEIKKLFAIMLPKPTNKCDLLVIEEGGYTEISLTTVQEILSHQPGDDSLTAEQADEKRRQRARLRGFCA